jgi:signal transduction histidine kinase
VRLSRGLLWTLAGASAAIALGLVPLIAATDFLSERGLWIVLDVVIGAGFTGVGLFAWYRRPDNRVGALMVATGFAWYLVVAGNTAAPLVWTIGNLASNLFVATAIHLLLAFPSGRFESRFDRVLIAVTYCATTVGWLPAVLFMDPEQLGCASCPRNLLVVASDAAFAERWLDGLSVCGVAITLTVLVRLVQRWRDASPAMRRAVTPVFVAGGALMLALAAVLVAGVIAEFGDGVSMALFWGCMVALGLVPYLFLAALVRGRWIRGQGLGALMRRLGQAPPTGGLREELARALGDPSVELAYWLPEPGRYVDADGRAVELPLHDPRRAVTEVEREERRIAAIVHDPALLDDVEQVRAAGAAAALALANERLEAELRAKVEQLSISRARIVESSDAARRKIERDLHDGAQQRLVSLAMRLGMLRSRVDGDPEAVRDLEAARSELDRALDELRELARGIHPSVLSDRGLDAAVEGLAQRAPLPVDVAGTTGERLPAPIESAAYFVVAEALTNVAKYARATHANVTLHCDGCRVLVEVSDDGVGGADPATGSGLRGLLDRVAALDGTLAVASEPGEGTTVRAAIPLERAAAVAVTRSRPRAGAG